MRRPALPILPFVLCLSLLWAPGCRNPYRALTEEVMRIEKQREKHQADLGR